MGSRILLVLPDRNLGGTRFGTLCCSDIFDSYVDSTYAQYCQSSGCTFRGRKSTAPAGVGRNRSGIPRNARILGGNNILAHVLIKKGVLDDLALDCAKKGVIGRSGTGSWYSRLKTPVFDNLHVHATKTILQ